MIHSRDTAIRVEQISKCYRIGMKEQMHDTFGGMMIDFLKRPIKNYRKYRSLYKFKDISSQGDASSSNDSDIIWALKGVSFQVKEGDVLGIIGRNGAGKSTLLKILSRVTNPTSGRVEIHGRISSLLEVGTGFNPELTGRENIYLNGTILGMKKKEIDEKFDEIVVFSEIGKFLDTPVKRYSTGMRVRLAFSVAAHLEPEILVVDEVLSVGDMSFQKKCLGKMEDVARGGRTVLFVSHNMGVVSDLCDKCILLSDGKIAAIGDTKDIVAKYLSSSNGIGHIDFADWTGERKGEGPMRILHLSTHDGDGRPASQFAHGEPICFAIGVSGAPGNPCIVGVTIRDILGRIIVHFSNMDDSCDLTLPSYESEIQMCLKENILNDGVYYVSLYLGDGFDITNDILKNCLSFTVESSSKGNVKCKSAVRIPAEWRIRSNVSKPGMSSGMHIS